MMHTPKSKSNYTSNSGFVLSLPQKTTRSLNERNFKNIRGQNGRNEKYISNLSELEACFAQLQEELKKTKHRTSSSEFKKRQALSEVEDINNQITPSSTKLKETNPHSNEDDMIQELCKLSQERDKAWALELAAVRKQHSLDSTALTSAKIEIQKLKQVLENVQTKRAENAEHEFVLKLKSEDDVNLKSEVSELRDALKESEERYREEYLSSTLQIREAYEQLEALKSESFKREAELVAELKRLKHNNVCAMELETTKASLTDTTKQLQAVTEENTKLKTELQNTETEKNKAVKRAAEARKISDSKLVYLTQEADRNSRRLARLMEQLEAAQAMNKETEMELRRQKVQCEQWKKAAETAAGMLNRGSEKQSDKSEHVTGDSQLGSELYNDDEDDGTKKKNVSVLQKMGVLWKKSNSMKMK